MTTLWLGLPLVKLRLAKSLNVHIEITIRLGRGLVIGLELNTND